MRIFAALISTFNKPTTVKPATDDSREVREMRKTCEMRHVCMGYFMLSTLFYEIDFSRVEMPRARSRNYARDKGIFSYDKG